MWGRFWLAQVGSGAKRTGLWLGIIYFREWKPEVAVRSGVCMRLQGAAQSPLPAVGLYPEGPQDLGTEEQSWKMSLKVPPQAFYSLA